jgi:hypothetical protein
LTGTTTEEVGVAVTFQVFIRSLSRNTGYPDCEAFSDFLQTLDANTMLYLDYVMTAPF